LVTHLEEQLREQKIDLVKLASQPEWKEILFNIVKKEGMNPWDIDISLLTSRFVDYINSLKRMDFRIPANAVLASSILLRYQSDNWKLSEEKEEYPLMFIPDWIIQEPVPLELEPITRVTKRKVTLEELINAIDDVMKKEKKAVKKQQKKPVVPESILDLVKVDNDNFEKIEEEVFQRVVKTFDKSKMTLFSNVLKEKTPEEVISVLIPILHLAQKGKLIVWQEEVFGEIFIQLNSDENAS